MNNLLYNVALFIWMTIFITLVGILAIFAPWLLLVIIIPIGYILYKNIGR